MFFFFNDTATTEIYTLSLHDALPICLAYTIGKLGIARWYIPDRPQEIWTSVGTLANPQYSLGHWANEYPLTPG